MTQQVCSWLAWTAMAKYTRGVFVATWCNYVSCISSCFMYFRRVEGEARVHCGSLFLFICVAALQLTNCSNSVPWINLIHSCSRSLRLLSKGTPHPRLVMFPLSSSWSVLHLQPHSCTSHTTHFTDLHTPRCRRFSLVLLIWPNLGEWLLHMVCCLTLSLSQLFLWMCCHVWMKL